jgi:hypothetical protein
MSYAPKGEQEEALHYNSTMDQLGMGGGQGRRKEGWGGGRRAGEEEGG